MCCKYRDTHTPAHSGSCPETLILHLARRKHVGSVSPYSYCDCSFNENVGVQTGGRKADEVHLLLLRTLFFLCLWEPEPTQAWWRVRNQWRRARWNSLIQRIVSVAGCRLTFTISSSCKNRKLLSDSSFGSKTRNYSYPVWRRMTKKVHTADVNFRSIHLHVLFSSLVYYVYCTFSLYIVLAPKPCPQ